MGQPWSTSIKVLTIKVLKKADKATKVEVCDPTMLHSTTPAEYKIPTTQNKKARSNERASIFFHPFGAGLIPIHFRLKRTSLGNTQILALSSG